MTVQRIWPSGLDNGLSFIDTTACSIYLLRQSTGNPVGDIFSYAQAVSTVYSLAFKTFSVGGAFGVPAASSVNGRTIASVAVTDGIVVSTGITDGWALVGTTTAQTLLATGFLSSASTFSSTANAWTLASYAITIPSST